MSDAVGAPERQQGPSLAQRLADSGPLYLEIGHALSLRPDLVPTAEWRPLTQQSWRRAPLPGGTVVDLVSAALGRPPTRVFDSFEMLPVRSGALVQVHQAVLDGEPVHVKLLRPGARQLVEDDAAWRKELQKLLGRGGDGRGSSAVVEDYIEQWLKRGTNLKEELGVVESLRSRRTGPWEALPEPYPEMSGADILVTQRLVGVPLAQLAPASSAAGAGGAAGGEPPGWGPVTSDQVGQIIVRAVLGQVTRRGWLQTDFVASNILSLPSGRIAYFDHCHVVDVPASTARQQVDYLAAVFDRDLPHMLPPLDRRQTAAAGDLADFRRALLRTVGRQPGNGGAAGRNGDGTGDGYDEIADGGQREFLVQVLALSRSFKVPLATGSPGIYGAVIAALGCAEGLCGSEAVEATGRSALRDARLQLVGDAIRSEQLEETGANLVSLLRDSPGQVHQLLSDLADGSFSLNVTATESRASARSRDARARLVVAAVCAVGLSVLVSAPDLPHPGGVSVAWPLGAALAVLYGWIFWAWRRLK
ncbi:MAG TPA: AarF/UbiB family protein [Acidimicrobiales bacterium]|nr:AarF/UbiB family protein [Acidimicrobiales bacterium]